MATISQINKQTNSGRVIGGEIIERLSVTGELTRGRKLRDIIGKDRHSGDERFGIVQELQRKWIEMAV